MPSVPSLTYRKNTGNSCRGAPVDPEHRHVMRSA